MNVAAADNRLAPGFAPAWRVHLAALAVVLLWLGVWYRDTALAMFVIWMRSDTFAHCILIPPIVLWLVWRRRAVLAHLTPDASFLPLLPAAAAGFGWLLGDLTAVNALTQLAFTSLIVLAVPALLGWRVASAIAFPLCFLFLAVPIGEFVMPVMMERTADFTVLALRASGIPVYREGLHFVIPSGAWSVVEACSGVRYLIASLTVGLLFAYLNYRTLAKRAAFVAVSIAVPVVANWLRAYMIVMLGHLSGNTIATGVDHLIYGWVFFGVVIMIMLAIGARWSDDMSAQTAPGADVPASAPPPRGYGALAAAGVGLALVAALPVVAGLLILKGESVAPVALAMPDEAGSWRRLREPLADWRPAYENPSQALTRTYASGARAVGVHVAYYRNQGYDRKLVSSSNVLVASGDRSWAQAARGTREVSVAGRTVQARTAELRGLDRPATEPGAARLTVWHWYWIGGRLTASDREAKLLGAWSRLTGAGDDAALVAVYARTESGADGAAVLNTFVAEAGAAIEAALARAREAR